MTRMNFLPDIVQSAGADAIAERPEHLISAADVGDICEVGKEGRAIIASTAFASQNDYNPRRGQRVANIINDFFEARHFSGKRIIELGPGHYGFALLARHLGAEVICIERDPAFVKLGRHLGFEVLDQDFNELGVSQFPTLFDGLWAKGTFNACGPKEENGIPGFIGRITELLKPDAWGWFVTVNKTNKAPSGWNDVDDYIQHRVEIQRLAFAAAGWEVSRIPEAQRKRYALNYANSRYFFTRGDIRKGLPLPPPSRPAEAEPPESESVESSSETPIFGPKDVVIKLVLGGPDAPAPLLQENPQFNKAFRAWQPHKNYLSNPWQYFVDFIAIAKRRGARFLTMSQALRGEYDPQEINVLLDHHIDFYPVETEIMCRWELENDVRSSVYLFNRLGQVHKLQKKNWSIEDLNIQFYQELERSGFEIGYHQNAVGSARHQILGTRYPRGKRGEGGKHQQVLELARKIFAEDVQNLRRYFNIRTFIPHGAGEENHELVDLPPGFEDLTWVYNGTRRKGERSPPLKWRNFSDSSGVRPYPMRGFGARYITYTDKLHINAHLLSPGLNHVLLHPGRFSLGMPYNTYSQPEKMNDRRFEHYSFGGLNFQDLPVNPKELLKKWEVENGIASVHVQSSDVPLRNQKYYVLSDDPTVLRQHIVGNDSCVPFFVIHRELGNDELQTIKLPPSTKDPSVRNFHLPQVRSDADSDRAFLEEFRHFINDIFAEDISGHLARSRFPVNVLDLRHISWTSEAQLTALASLLERWPPECSLHISGTLQIPLHVWRKRISQNSKLTNLLSCFELEESAHRVTIRSRR